MIIMRTLETREGWCFQANHVRGVDARLADGLTRWDAEKIHQAQNAECPEIAWQVQELGDVERQMCSEILGGGTPVEELKLRLEGLTRRVGGCG